MFPPKLPIRSIDKQLWNMSNPEKILLIIVYVAAIMSFAPLGLRNLLNEEPPIRVRKVIEQTDTHVIVETSIKGGPVEGAKISKEGQEKYVCYGVEDKGEYKFVRIYEGYNGIRVDDYKIKIDTDGDDKYICFKNNSDSLQLYVVKNKKDNKWEKANIVERLIYYKDNLFTY